jgi:polar amino acid transport system substrate-binding protein
MRIGRLLALRGITAAALTLCSFLLVADPAPTFAQNTLVSPPGNQRTVTLACNPFPPSKIASDAVLPGYDVEVLRAAFASRNLTLITPFYPWQRAYFLARIGQVDGLCSCSYLPERKDEFFYSDLLGHAQVAFYTIGNATLDRLTEIGDARNMTVGIVNGYSLEAPAREAGLDVMLVNSEATLIDMLLSRRIDVALSFKAPIDFQLHKTAREGTGIDQIRSKVMSTNPYYSCISRNAQNPELLLTELNTGLAAIRANGLYDKILAKYGLLKQGNAPLQD